MKKSLISGELVGGLIRTVRGRRVIVDADLAELYEVETKQLIRAVKRNRERFPDDFMFELTGEEAAALRCQIGTSNKGRGGRRYLPLVFTEYGVAMLSSVLNSPRAVAANIEIMRAFSRLRGILAEQRQLVSHLDELEKRCDAQFAEVFAAIRKLMDPPARPRKKIGFWTP